jgi:hypothetical protein
MHREGQRLLRQLLPGKLHAEIGRYALKLGPTQFLLNQHVPNWSDHESGTAVSRALSPAKTDSSSALMASCSSATVGSETSAAPQPTTATSTPKMDAAAAIAKARAKCAFMETPRCDLVDYPRRL